MSQYALEDLKEAGIKDIAIILGDIAPEKVVEHYGDGSKFGVDVTYVRQGEPRGIAQAIGLTRDFVRDEPFVVYLGDNLLRNGICDLVEEFADSAVAAQVALCQVNNPQAFGVAELDTRGKVVRLTEKPKAPKSDLALVGVYMFRRSIFDEIDSLKPSWRGELEITEAIQRLIDMGLEVDACRVSGWWKDTGKPEDVLEANQLILSDIEPCNKGRLEQDVSATGTLVIQEGTVIKAKSTLRGPLIIGKGCEIGPGTYIGPYTSIGDNVVVRGGEIENSIILADTAIECKKRIVDSLIGKGSRIIPSEDSMPKGYRLMVGENTFLSI